MEEGERILNDAVEYLKRNHPYPEDVFGYPTKKEWVEFHKVLANAGMSSGGFVGHCCRIGYDASINQLENIITD